MEFRTGGASAARLPVEFRTGRAWAARLPVEFRTGRAWAARLPARQASAVVSVATYLTSRNTRVCSSMIRKAFSCYKHHMFSWEKCAFEAGEEVISGARLTRVIADARPGRPAPPHMPIVPCDGLYSVNFLHKSAADSPATASIAVSGPPRQVSAE